jgi:hypothetical protein
MGLAKNYPPCFQFFAAFSRYDAALDWFWERISQNSSDIALLSPRFPFVESSYYHKSMGSDLMKQFAVLSAWYDPADLAADKRLSNDLEHAFAASSDYPEERPLNIDPGYMSMTKLVLASTKNREHRIYLRDGIYAEVTLAYRDQQWQAMPWTYPDYQREDFRVFFHQARKRLASSVNALQPKQHPSPIQDS